MKKILVLLMALIMVSGVLFAADPLSLEVYGYVPQAEPSLTFTKTQTLESPGINLKANTEVHNTGNGVEVGNWTINTFNHLGTESYSVKYTFDPLLSATSGLSLAYNVLEYDGGTLSSAIVTDGTGPSYLAPAGDTSKTRTVRVRLTEGATTTATGLTVSAIDNFTSTITLNLIVND